MVLEGGADAGPEALLHALALDDTEDRHDGMTAQVRLAGARESLAVIPSW